MAKLESCGDKHLKLAVIIIGIVTVIVGAVWGRAEMIERGNQKLETRLRSNEENIARFEERQNAMLELLKEIKVEIKK
jgi:hypothetical protein